MRAEWEPWSSMQLGTIVTALLVLNFQHIRAGGILDASLLSRKIELASNGHLPPEQPTPLSGTLSHTTLFPNLTCFLWVQGLGEGLSEVFWEASTCCSLLGYRETLRTFWLALKSAPTWLCPSPSSCRCLQGSSCIERALRNEYLSEFQINPWGLMFD